MVVIQITAMLASELRVMEEKQASTAALTGQRQEAERAITAAANDSARLIVYRIAGANLQTDAAR